MKKLNMHDLVLRQAVDCACHLPGCLPGDPAASQPAGNQAPKPDPTTSAWCSIPAGPNDHGYNEMSVQGLQRAESELGVNGTVYQTTGAGDYQAAFNQCVADGNALCLGVGFLLYQTISNTASLNPGVNFALLDFEWSNARTNLRGISFVSRRPLTWQARWRGA